MKRSIIVGGHKTSVSLEDEFWQALREIARVRGETVSKVAASINSERCGHNFSSAIRVFVLNYYRQGFATAAITTQEKAASDHRR